MPSVVPAANAPVRARGATVLDDGDGPELCLGIVAQPRPPVCAGPPIDGWVWADGSFESASGVRWGEFSVVGAFDGERFTVESVGPPEEAVADWKPLGTPCPEPPGGWQIVDLDLTTFDSREATIQAAHDLADFGTLWVDQSRNPALNADGGFDRGDEDLVNDPRFQILNVAVAGDPAVAEARLRETWGGMLCVSSAETTLVERTRISNELLKLPGILRSGPSADVVEIKVIHDDGSLQAWVDETYGAGAAVVESALVPVD